MAKSSRNPAFFPILSVGFLFFTAGFTTLVYQTAWQRVLTQEIGIDSVSVTFVVTIFMVGLGFGSYFGGFLSKNYKGNVSRFYGITEILIALYALIAIPLIRFSNTFLASLLQNSSIYIDFIVNLIILILPIFLMGMSTPLIIHIMRNYFEKTGLLVGIFYGVNIIGAACGALVTGLFLIELFGLMGATRIAVIIDMLIGCAFLVLSKTYLGQSKSVSQNKISGKINLNLKLPISIIIAALAFGFVSLSLEIVLFRLLSHFFQGLALLFPVMLAAYLVAMGFGNLISGIATDKAQNRMLAYSWVLLIFSFVTIAAVFWASERFLNNIGITFQSIQPWRPRGEFLSALFMIFLGMLPVFFVSGFFPVVMKFASRNIQNTGIKIGAVLFVYTIGNILGAFITGILLFDTIGTINTVRLCLLLIATGTIAIFWKKKRSLKAITVNNAPLIISALVFSVLLPGDYYYGFKRLAEGQKPIYPAKVHETRLGVESIYKLPNMLDIRTNRAIAAKSLIDIKDIDFARYRLKDLEVFDPQFKPRRIMLIGIGNAVLSTAWADIENLEKLVIVELSKTIVDYNLHHSAKKITETLHYPEVEIVIADGRRYIQKALSRGDKFDLIEIGIQKPIAAGTANVYTREFFERTQKILSHHGYLMTYDYTGVLRTGLEVFKFAFAPESLFDRYVLFTDRDLFGQKEIPVTGKTAKELEVYDVNNDTAIDFFLYDKSLFTILEINTDDHPVFEYNFLKWASTRRPFSYHILSGSRTMLDARRKPKASLVLK